MHKQESTLFDLDLGVKVTQNVAQYPLHHVTYAPVKFEVATSNSLGVTSESMCTNYWLTACSSLPRKKCG